MAAMDVEVRRAEVGDAERVVAVYLAAFRSALPHIRLAHPNDEIALYFRYVVIPEEEAWVAVHDTGVAGFVVIGSDILNHLYVAPGRQRRGIGSRLLALAKEVRPTGLRLFTFEANLGAQAFYETHGFEEVDRSQGDRNEEGEPDIQYEWRPPLRD